MTTPAEPGGDAGMAVRIGERVVTADTVYLGNVKEISGACFKIDAPFEPDYWLAFDCIADNDGAEIRLRFSQQGLDDMKVEGSDHTGIHRHQ
jgi:hypothetical protein